jgi:hypothetical protein
MNGISEAVRQLRDSSVNPWDARSAEPVCRASRSPHV